jgi:hypothetical protein
VTHLSLFYICHRITNYTKKKDLHLVELDFCNSQIEHRESDIAVSTVSASYPVFYTIRENVLPPYAVKLRRLPCTRPPSVSTLTPFC